MAHEIAHNLGMRHDDPNKGGKDESCYIRDTNFMSGGKKTWKWSDCNREEFQAHYLWVIKQKDLDWCMEEGKQ